MSNDFYQHHKEDVDKHGFNKAVILCLVRAKVYEYQERGTNYHEYWNWVFCSAKSLNKLFPFMSLDVIGRMLREVEDNEIIMSRKLSLHRSNQVKYYTILQHLTDYKPSFAPQSKQMTSTIQKNKDERKFKKDIKIEEKRVNDIINNNDWMNEYDFPF